MLLLTQQDAQVAPTWGQLCSLTEVSWRQCLATAISPWSPTRSQRSKSNLLQQQRNPEVMHRQCKLHASCTTPARANKHPIAQVSDEQLACICNTHKFRLLQQLSAAAQSSSAHPSLTDAVTAAGLPT